MSLHSIPSFLLASPFLFCGASAYRLFEYRGENCNSAQLNMHRLAGPSECTLLNNGVTESLLVTIDNVNDTQYDVVLYSSESCDGQIIGLIHNTNGCLPVDAGSFGRALSVRVVRIRRADTESDVELDLLYNMESVREGTIQTPISPGVFITVEKADHDEEGFFRNEAAGKYENNQLEMSEVPVLPLAHVDPSSWVYILADRVGRNPWRSFRQGPTILIDAYNTGASTLTYVRIQISGTQQRECNTEWTSGAIVRDGVEAELNAGGEVTDVAMDFCTHNQECFAFVAKFYIQNAPREGNCPDP
ncbi:hypothetical protein BJX61DRAFT_540810 [Aspergillus egyptiacus]|nr:hypothetical protein BJX61DRAFT_540810 [Aspergillus egyptiacus]